MPAIKRTGFTLVEVVFAIFLITLGTGSVFNLMQKSSNLASVARGELEAAYLAQEGVEIVRNIRDGNWLKQRTNPAVVWDDGLTGCTQGSGGCEADYNDTGLAVYADRFLKIDGGFYNYDSGSQTSYKRKIIISEPNPNELSVSVEVSRTGMASSVVVQTELHKWR